VRSVAAVGRWSTRRPWRAIALWLGFVVAAVAAGAAVGTDTLDNGANGESKRGYALIDQHRLWGQPHEIAFLHSATLQAGDPRFRATIADVVRRIGTTEVEVESPLSGGKRFVSRDGHAAVVVVSLGYIGAQQVRDSILSAAQAHPGVTIEETGDITADEARNRVVDRDLHRAELLSVPVTLLVLLFAFGAVVAALVPVLLALTAVVAALGLLGPISQLSAIDDATQTVIVLIGMAVGVDYSLFYVMRSREERQRGLPSHEALARTARTSGRTVLVSGTTVAIAMAGMFVIGSQIFTGIAAGTIAVVACAVAGSVTVLPALLELLGARIDRGRIPFLPHLRTDSVGSRFWPAVVDWVVRRPVLSLALGAALLVALALPALSLRVSKPSDLALTSQHEPALATLGRIRAAFPGASEPAVVVAAGPAGARPRAEKQVACLERLAQARGIAHPPFDVRSDGTAVAVSLPLTGAGDNTASRRAIDVLRRDLVPATLGAIPGVETAVTGTTAEDVDFTRQMKHGIPYVIAFVLGFAFLLLLVAFRSLVVPLKAIVLNLLSVGASYGVIALVFQHHWAEPLLGFQSNGTIISWLPLFLFVILFGLSMDYHVFILSRVREAVDGGQSTEQAVRQGITVTAGIVTSAAFVMVGVFSLFGSLSSLELKQAGVGLAAAVLIDGTIVRAVLLPSSMTLLGEWNWYLPRWLQRLPQASIEAPPARDVL
jgi:uncharacterized membrane protein YdfJ with MMPL/SSD domain